MSRDVPASVMLTSLGVGVGVRFCGLCVSAAVVIFADMVQVVTTVVIVGDRVINTSDLQVPEVPDVEA